MTTRLLGQLCATVLFLNLTSTAAAFELQTLAGQRTQLANELAPGRWNLVMFWSLDCIPCERQKPMIESFYRTYTGNKAEVLGVVLDGPDKFSEVLNRLANGPTSFTQLLALSDVFREQFSRATGHEFKATPTYWLFDPEGRSAGLHTGTLTRAVLDRIVTQSR